MRWYNTKKAWEPCCCSCSHDAQASQCSQVLVYKKHAADPRKLYSYAQHETARGEPSHGAKCYALCTGICCCFSMTWVRSLRVRAPLEKR